MPAWQPCKELLGFRAGLLPYSGHSINSQRTWLSPACHAAQVLKPARKPRKKLVSFAGGFLFWQDPGGLRSEMRDLFQASGTRPSHDSMFRI